MRWYFLQSHVVFSQTCTDKYSAEYSGRILCRPLEFSLCAALISLVLCPWAPAVLVSQDSHLYLYNSVSAGLCLGSPVCATHWKLSEGYVLVQPYGSSHLFSISWGSLSFITWCPVSCILFWIFCPLFSCCRQGERGSVWSLSLHLDWKYKFLPFVLKLVIGFWNYQSLILLLNSCIVVLLPSLMALQLKIYSPIYK